MSTQPFPVLKAPFPWFGGKSRAAHLVWERFGDVPNYIEPFAGSLAVLLGRPHAPHVETVNDVDCYVANFWRAVQADPDAVAFHADWPVNEADLCARNALLAGAAAERAAWLMSDPKAYDAQVAGWWLHGVCAWIGAGWTDGVRQLPNLDGRGGKGIHGPTRPDVAARLSRLCDRLRHTRVACGDFMRVLAPTVTRAYGPTGVFLDPPYDSGNMAYVSAGAAGTGAGGATPAERAREWALANGQNPNLRIAICGHAGAHDSLLADGWTPVSWTARGGYGLTAEAVANVARETIWFSPHCLRPEVSLPPPSLFDADPAEAA